MRLSGQRIGRLEEARRRGMMQAMSARKHPTSIAALAALGLVGACFADIPELAEGSGGAAGSGAAGSGAGAAGFAGTAGTGAAGLGGTAGTGAADASAGAAGDAGAGFGGSAGGAGDAGTGIPPECTNSHFVASDGDDANPGSMAEPWKTLDRVNTAMLSPGDCVLLRRGDVWMNELDVGWSGTQGEPIIVAAYGVGNAPALREVWVIEREYVTLQGLRVSGAANTGVSIFDTRGVTLQDCEVEYAGAANIAVKNARDLLVRRVHSHDAVSTGLDLYSEGDSLSQDVVIEDSSFYDNGDAGITMMGLSTYRILSPVVRRNLLYGNRQGINDLGSDDAQYYHNVLHSQHSAVFNVSKRGSDPGELAARNARIFNNVFYNPTLLEWGTVLYVGAHNAGVVVKNNVFVSYNDDRAVAVAAGGEVSLDHNVYFGGTLKWHDDLPGTLADWQASSGQDLNSVIDDPLFEDPPSDLHVLPGSPCIDTGVDVGLTQDIDGDALPQGDGFDIGVQDE
jgi:Right handed beta helix region